MLLGNWNQGSLHARQVLYQRSHILSFHWVLYDNNWEKQKRIAPVQLSTDWTVKLFRRPREIWEGGHVRSHWLIKTLLTIIFVCWALERLWSLCIVQRGLWSQGPRPVKPVQCFEAIIFSFSSCFHASVWVYIIKKKASWPQQKRISEPQEMKVV